ncbi:MAG: sarcinarray family MAST domain-containing protein [Euryarchaeota archaeon]|nr:sarcinarray family MAST domain-containing protein [Euryarchaeota archaeon]
MNNLLKLIMVTVIFASIQLAGAVATENEYGNVKAWYNGQEATVKGVKLKIGETVDVKLTVTSNISGHIFVQLTNPLVTEPYNVLKGPKKIGEYIDNYDVPAGWSNTYTWTLVPNGAWKNGNAPINVFVQFTKIENGKIKGDKKIEFTIADPYILDEQYPGSSPAQTTGAAQPSPTGTSSEPQQAPFLEAAGAIAIVLGAWMWMRKGTY